MFNTKLETGLYLWVEDGEGHVISNNLFFNLAEKEAREEAEKLHQANNKLHARYIAHCKEIFKI